MQIIAHAITGKHGMKGYDKVNQRIGRLKQKYSSVYRMIYAALQMKEVPYIRKKSVALKIEPNDNGKIDLQIDTS